MVTYNIDYFIMELLGMKLKISLCTLIYRKAINLSSSSLAKSNVGQMVNLLANDVSKFNNNLFTVLYLFTNPFLIIITTIVLWTYYGWAIIVGISIILIFIPMKILLGKLYSKLRLQAAILGDERLNLLNEMLAGMRLVKMYTWELPFAALIEKIRAKEIKTIRKFLYARGILLTLGFPLSRLYSCLIFLVFFLFGGQLNAQIVFVTTTFSIIIYFSVISLFSFAVNLAAEIFISLKRLQHFLLLQEKDNSSVNVIKERLMLTKCGIWMENVKAAWNKDIEPTLDDISLSIKPGELLTIIGSVGSGKTSLLMSILREIPIISGRVSVKGKVSYASQEAWIFNGTIRENILFGEEYQKKKYSDILKITALEKDISLFPEEDLTVVGERGVMMSGGQKARINLARALYVDADIFLLDDPLSAVDAPVAKHLFVKCIKEYLKEKVCILVTHQIQFLNSTTKILVLNKGKCEFFGNRNEMKCCECYAEDSRENEIVKSSMELSTVCFNDKKIPNIKQVDVLQDVEINNNVNTNHKQLQEDKRHGVVGLSVYKAYVNAGAVCATFVMTLVSASLFYEMFMAASIKLHNNMFRCIIRTPISFLDSNPVVYMYIILITLYFFKDIEPTLDDISLSIKPGELLTIIGSVGSGKTSLLMSILREIPIISGRVSVKGKVSYASQEAWIFNGTIRENILFGEEYQKKKYSDILKITALEKDISLFPEEDLTVVGERGVMMSGGQKARINLARALYVDADIFLLDDPLSAVDAPVAKHLFVKCIKEYLKEKVCILVTHQIQFLNSTTKILVLNKGKCEFFGNRNEMKCCECYAEDSRENEIVKSSMELSTVCFNDKKIPNIKQVDVLQDVEINNNVVYFVIIGRSPVFSHLSVSLYGLTTIRALNAENKFKSTFNKYQDKHTATWFIYVALNRWNCAYSHFFCLLNLFISFVVLTVSMNEDDAGSKIGLVVNYGLMVFLLFQWSIKHSSEIDYMTNSVTRILNYSNLKPEAAYESSPEIQPPADWPQKGNIEFKNIGIVGRTGAGKSSIISALFRMTEPNGNIIIDGVVTQDIGLRDLRSKISIIPQDPILFTGPLRRNIDPFNEYSEDILWQAIEEVELKDVIRKLPGGLDAHLSEGGRNFSIGQRQLICLARAILRQNKILNTNHKQLQEDKRHGVVGLSVYKAYVNAGAVCATFVMTLVSASLFYEMFMAASIKLHNNMFRCIIRTPISFLDSNPVGRSPVFSHLSVSLYGLTTIRALNAENKFKSTFNKYQDKHTATWFIYVALNRWNCAYSHFFCLLNLFISFVVLTVSMNEDDAGSKIGLVVNYGLMVFLLFQWSIKHSSEIDYMTNSVTRILNYSNLKPEAAYESSPEIQPPADWPQKGNIEFKNVSLQYSNCKNTVLNNLSFRIKSGEKIGIVGRTGAGKSSIISALFRMTEPNGNIIIDGVVTQDIGLRDLRSKISIIPQDPILFTGPLRRNIDPFNEYSEDILWQAIEEVELKDVIRKLPGGLDAHLSEGGRNFSIGQRQLICLARAILRQNKILVMDEATSNIDNTTDSRIQKIVREKLQSSTVLTIAHRLHTIIDSDRVLVLDKGKIQEFDMPYKLLENKEGTFYNLVKNTGNTSMKQLNNAAKDKYYCREITESTKL
ncbi:multidrug resistance-associated protein 4-like [Centruroides sculpturatus]|uniref:multidrug resistance-associated protein 4-like n=1 Tax=Centruroides sculpturatus TaxID=218467 RepID=UPI000C6D1413|nr:multidrug resistance-associated protein 4-like [Centruroides sculpturatus]